MVQNQHHRDHFVDTRGDLCEGGSVTEPKFTPGPWNADGVYVCDENDAEVALCDGDNWEPNSYLIAAAPELFDALLVAEESVGDLKSLEIVRAALKKARGES